ncbi:hypothetical protein T440DRAFT_314210 [Plenodomus tracheiphilus IPT5]|uniref:Rhodopsin domain-containing protein n=1 Tax=Plenodomus tracheiphilus IPT5 TaxID=1408161 RepID=A0A6A7APF6_9PLEO|nr:hypothetical protein T440DRAFT_314210 [Plenodomus tracheiphilus IPT5]
MSDQFTSIIIGMMAHPPDPNEPMPLANRKSTMFGVTISFHVLSWIFVCIRLHTRLRIIREPGWDDAFVVVAALFNLVSVVAFLGGTEYGLGHHLIYNLDILSETMHWLYTTNAAYHTTTALIKISLLLQYLRVFRDGVRRRVCYVLLTVVIAWGLAFSFMAWVPCFPVSGFWNRQTTPPPTCYGFGYSSVNQTKSWVLSFAITNMVLDIAIFAVPLSEYFKRNLGREQLLAMTGLFSLGSIVVLMSILRLWTTFKHSSNIKQAYDFTWWYPEVLIISCLEIDFAIMCASMPIFWPTVVASLGQIFVTNEVRVTHHQRLVDNSGDNFEMDRSHSLKSNTSTQGLTCIGTLEANGASDQKTDHMDGFEPGKNMSSGVSQVEVQPHAQKPRML